MRYYLMIPLEPFTFNVAVWLHFATTNDTQWLRHQGPLSHGSHHGFLEDLTQMTTYLP